MATLSCFGLDEVWSKKPIIIRVLGKKVFHWYGTPSALRMDDSFFESFRNNVSTEPRTWGNWHRKIKAICPFQFWFREHFSFKVRYWTHSYWQNKYYDFITWYKDYSVLKMPTVKRGDYLDPCEQLKHAMFAVFLNYMSQDTDRHSHDLGTWAENKESFKNKREFDKYNKQLKQQWADCLEIENYILVERIQRQTKTDSFLTSHNFKAYHKMEDADKKREEEILMKIIKMRASLWT